MAYRNMAGKKVLITGAAQGIGKCLCNEFAKEGCVLIMTDINGEALEKAAAELSAGGASVHTYEVNVADREQVSAMAEEVIRTHGGLDILVNNAGIGHNAEIVETSLDTWKKLMDVNFWGPLYHVYAFLPHMIRQGRGHIVNVSSGQAFFRLPTWGPYSIIKLALGAFSELLRLELKKFDVKVTTVYPYMVNTGFYNDAACDTWGSKLSMLLLPLYSQSPQRVARIIFKAVKKGKAVEMVNVLNGVGKLTRMFSPVSNVLSSMTLLALGKDPEVLKNQLNIN
ncbi:MAG: SDR family oxidoreductase [Deltaproteobacteria bacterium]|nr:SDR family oxidoreductase [Deltaproteobacteria bacterium]